VYRQLVDCSQNDNRAIFQAASYAQPAADYLHTFRTRPKEAAA
jgi:antirestriction protein ArdC